MEPLLVVQQLTVAADYSQIYVYDANQGVEDAGIQTEDDNSLLRALDDAYESRRFVGYDGGLVDIITPSQWNARVPLRLEVLDGPPPLDLDDWDHVIEVPLPAPSGTLAFQASRGGRPVEATIPPGSIARGSPDAGSALKPTKAKRASGSSCGRRRRRSRSS